MNLPTKITISRIALIPLMLIFYGLTKLHLAMYIGVTLIFIIASGTDYVDGYLARKNNQVTDLGKFLDPIADKILVITALFIIVEARILPVVFSAVACSLIVAREFIVSVLRQMAASKGVVLSADKAGKLKTFFTCMSIPPLLISPYFYAIFNGWAKILTDVLYYFGLGLFVVSVVLTVYSGVNYVIKNKDVFNTKTDNNVENNDER